MERLRERLRKLQDNAEDEVIMHLLGDPPGVTNVPPWRRRGQGIDLKMITEKFNFYSILFPLVEEAVGFVFDGASVPQTSGQD